MVARLTLLNDELILLGENPFSAPDDGSPEWLIASAGYDAALEFVLAKHDWKFGKRIIAVEDRTDPDDPNWDDAYDKPSGCLHVVKIMDADGGTITERKILGDKILVNNDEGILVECIMEPDPDLFPGEFLIALRHGIKAGIFGGLKKDYVSARAAWKDAAAAVAEARPRGDLEEPGKARFVSTLATSRGRRRG